MKTLRTLLLSIVAAAVLALGSAMLSGCSQSEAAKLVAVDGRSVTVETAAEGPKTHEVAPDAKITLDGKPAELNDLQPGDKVTVGVTTNQEGSLEAAKEVAVVIDAKRAEEGPADSEAERSAPAEEAVPPPQEPGLNEPNPAEEDPSPSGEAEPASPVEEAVSPPEESGSNEPNPAEENPSASGEAEPESPAEEAVTPPEESGSNEPNATEEKEASFSEGAAADLRADSPPGAERGLSIVPGHETPLPVLHEGEISFVGKDLVRLRYRDGPPSPAAEVTFLITEGTKIFINGKAAGIENLRQGMTVAITAEQHEDFFVAKQIEVRPALV